MNMFRIFRSLRISLLGHNKIGKYLKYAFGEVILVVIGILLALQINTWNEERKISKERNQFMQSIKEDLIADTLDLNETLGQWNIQLAELNTFKQQVNSTKTIDSLIFLVRYEFSPYFSSFSGFNDNTYRSMLNTGKLSILHPELRKVLQAHYHQQLDTKEWHDNQIELYQTVVRTYTDQFPMNIDAKFIRNQALEDIIWKDINPRQLLLVLNSWGTRKSFYYQTHIPRFEDRLQETAYILKTYFNK
ncbi:hypothetical protein SAMN04487988_10281 [Algoriphagus hitonicola]|uniref:Uncharacterized protein n=2 Tax=Algoriphagus hitonicola TaxID=435880 RepID=A0A1I2Q9Y8_9BACT|nr:hypothetical protein SAMN04487988_10281 [Algoriphagus hitonicola]